MKLIRKPALLDILVFSQRSRWSTSDSRRANTDHPPIQDDIYIHNYLDYRYILTNQRNCESFQNTHLYYYILFCVRVYILLRRNIQRIRLYLCNCDRNREWVVHLGESCESIPVILWKRWLMVMRTIVVQSLQIDWHDLQV